MLIKFKVLEAENFKSHQHIIVNFGERTDITGDNGFGKSTIIESITFLINGTNAFNNKLDPTPLTYECEETKVSLLFEVDGKQYKLGRSIKKGKTSYYVNDVPSKATEFNSFVETLFDKELFFSLYNPNYFFTLHWEKQRAMLLQYVQSPISKEILKHMPEEQAKCLEKLLKKNSLTDIEKIHKADKVKYEKSYIQAQSKTKTLKEQLDKLSDSKIDIVATKHDIAELDTQIKEIEKTTLSADDNNRKISNLQTQINSYQERKKQMQEKWKTLKNEDIQDTCRVCKQPLQDESLQAAHDDKEQRIAKFKEEFDQVIAKRKELEEQLNQLDYIDVSEQLEKIRNLDSKKQQLQQELYNQEQFEKLTKDVKCADADESATHNALKAAIFTLDCIKAFKAKEAEMQAEKVQALFTTLSVRLFKQNKGDSELKPDFEIEMDGKPYRTLSLSESIRAGLELREVLSQQSELIMPVFVDNAESITRFKEPSGQIIVSRVVAGQELKIETGEEQ